MDYSGSGNVKGHRGQPLFPHHIWNCYTFTLEYLPWSNNALESLNNAFKVSANVARPTLTYFMNRLVEEHAKINFNILHQPQGTKLTEKELYLI
uniref:Transposase n=1 Tax=Acrobeloides nanus TaxID=290746 RepID=A0A914DBW3_9BILA